MTSAVSDAAHRALAAGKPFTPPGVDDFNLPPVAGHTELLSKSAFLLVFGGIVVAVLFLVSSRRTALVPGKLQFAGESAYNFVRNSVGRDVIGERDFIRYVPLLVSIFFFVLINNLFGIVPILQFPSFSRVNFAYGLAILVWLIYNGVGIQRHGFLGYLKHTTVPAGVPGYILPLIIPLEFLSNIIVRPVTLSLRLFANMFAGHLLLLLFASGGSWLLFDATGVTVVLKIAGVLSYALGIAVGGLEFIIEVLQAYVFVLLTATYIGGALAEEH